jgi:hypothetical protein
MIPDYEESEGPRSMIHNMREFPLKFKSLRCVFFLVFLFYSSSVSISLFLHNSSDLR